MLAIRTNPNAVLAAQKIITSAFMENVLITVDQGALALYFGEFDEAVSNTDAACK